MSQTFEASPSAYSSVEKGHRCSLMCLLLSTKKNI